MSDKKAIFKYGDTALDFEVMDGTLGPKVVDVRKFFGVKR